MRGLGFLAAAMLALSGPHYEDPLDDLCVYVDLAVPGTRRHKRLTRKIRNARKRRRGWA